MGSLFSSPKPAKIALPPAPPPLPPPAPLADPGDVRAKAMKRRRATGGSGRVSTMLGESDDRLG